MLPTHMTLELFQRARHRGRWYRLWGALRGRPSCLLDLATVASCSTIRARHATGLQIVPIRQILGSEGRGGLFDAAFHPIRTHTELRWRQIAHAGLVGITLPPVELIRIGDAYFVRDGHHRISVARAFGQKDIDAVVTVWQVEPQPAPSQAPDCTFAGRRLRMLMRAENKEQRIKNKDSSAKRTLSQPKPFGSTTIAPQMWCQPRPEGFYMGITEHARLSRGTLTLLRTKSSSRCFTSFNMASRFKGRRGTPIHRLADLPACNGMVDLWRYDERHKRR